MDQPPLTIKQQREQKRQMKLAARSAQASSQTTKRFVTWGSVIVGLGLIVYGLIWAAKPAANVNNPNRTTLAMQADDHVEGAREAKAILIEYSDFQCPACKAYDPIVRGLHEAYGDKLAIVYRHFPLTSLHPNAKAAAIASEAASAQGKFWEWHDLMFDRQDTWAPMADPTNTFVDYAGELGLDKTKFKNDLKSTAIKDIVDRDIGWGNDSAVNATPSFFLNGKFINNPKDLESFKALIDPILQ